MAVNLTEGAIAMLFSGKWQTADVQPVLQVIDVRMVPQTLSGGGEKQERYRLLLSDGLFYNQGMLATQQNELVRSQKLQNGSVVQLKEYVCNNIRDRAIIIIINLDVILEVCERIGDAKPYQTIGGSEPSLSRSPSPMQPFNQSATTTGTPQTFMGGSVPRPTNSPNYPPQQDHTTGLHSYGGSVPRPASSPIYPPQQDHTTGLHSYGGSVPRPANSPNYPPQQDHTAGLHSYGNPVSRTPADSYARPVQPTYNKPSSTNRGPMAKNEAPPKNIPIAALNPYQGRWTIKARVTSKAELRRYNNAKGDGKVFSFDLLDSDGGEIRVTCFNAVADQFYDQVEIGKVYYLSKGSVKPASKAFNHLKNDHEILLDNTSTIQPCLDDDNSIPHQQFHFRSIADIEGLENNSVLDIIGVVSSITPSSSLMRKNGTETQKRTLQLKDMSGKSVDVTLWGNFCSTDGQALQNLCDSGVFPVLAVKSARVSDFNGKSVGTISTSQLCIDPDFPEVRKIKAWFDSVGKITPSVSLSRDAISRTDVRKTLSQIKDEKLGTSEKPDWITVSATIIHLRVENFCYTACPIMIGDRQCSKKVIDTGDGKWRCDRCEKIVDQCEYRYILSIQIQDHTGAIWVTAFQESGEEIIGVSAKDLHYMKENDDDSFTETIRNVLYAKFNFKLKVKEETYSDEQRVKSTVVKAEKLKLASDTSFYLELLKKENPGGVGTRPKVEIGIPSYGGMKDSAPYTGVGQQVSQYGNQYGGSSRVGSNCNSCGGVGHNSANCPSGYSQGGRFNSSDVSGVSNAPSAYGGGSGGGNTRDECYKCHKSGHWASNCPGGGNVGSGYGGGSGSGGGTGGASGDCFKCHQPGHWAKDCPGVSNGGGNVASGRYGGQYVGGY